MSFLGSKGNPRLDVGTSYSLVDFGFTSNYVGYFFGGSHSEFWNDEWG